MSDHTVVLAPPTDYLLPVTHTDEPDRCLYQERVVLPSGAVIYGTLVHFQSVDEPEDDYFQEVFWTEREAEAIRSGVLPYSCAAWTYSLKGDEWQGWLGGEYGEERMYRSPSGRWFRGHVIDGLPWIVGEDKWSGSGFPTMFASDNDKVREALALYWCSVDEIWSPTPEDQFACRFTENEIHDLIREPGRSSVPVGKGDDWAAFYALVDRLYDERDKQADAIRSSRS